MTAFIVKNKTGRREKGQDFSCSYCFFKTRLLHHPLFGFILRLYSGLFRRDGISSKEGVKLHKERISFFVLLAEVFVHGLL